MEIRGRAQLLRERIVTLFHRPAETVRVYGVPRGGAAVAAMVGFPVDVPLDAEVIVDDIIDSGRTRDAFARDPKSQGKPFLALYDKTDGDAEAGWIEFPWERGNARDVEDHVVRLLQFIGEDASRDGLKDTPRRFVKALREMTEGYGVDVGALLAKRFDVAHDSMVVVGDVPFSSLCEHHLMPFRGTATIGYIPSDGRVQITNVATGETHSTAAKRPLQVVGLSKLTRLLHAFARRLQVQERLGDQVADALVEHLEPLGAGVLLRARHLCTEIRGVRTGGRMETCHLRGVMLTDPSARAEFLSLGRSRDRE